MSRSGIVFFNDIKCGLIIENDDTFIFKYDSEYLKREDKQAISLTMPLREEEYKSNILFPFFDGLIPEGLLFEIAINTWKLDRNDRMGLLLKVRSDPIGAVSIRENIL